MQQNKTNYLDLNAMINLLGADGKLQLEKDKEAARAFFLQHVNQNTTFFHNLEEKLEYLVEQSYYEQQTINLYSFGFIKSLFKQVYAEKFRFSTFMGAYKYYTGYTLKTFDGTRYLERFEDRVAMTALYLARGNEQEAQDIASIMIKGIYQPATPTFLNASKAQRGELVSCFLLRMEDNMESIGRSFTNALQLSKRGGGVAFNLTNLREEHAPIKYVENQASGVQPVMKIFEDAFSYADQLGARQGAGAVYLSVHHMDFPTFLDTKRENADEKIRIKTLSLGAVVSDAFMQAYEKGEDYYMFSAYDIAKVYGVEMGDLDITKNYQDLIKNPKIGKKRISARLMMQRIAEIQPESGYPYILFEDTANKANPSSALGRVNMSNLCSEILQRNSASYFNESGEYKVVGKDISCNLGSINIARAMDNARNLGKIVNTAHRALTSVSIQSSLDCVPSIREGNVASRSVGLGQMNLHGFLARERIHYDSIEALDFTNLYFAAINYHSIVASCELAEETGSPFEGFEKTTYATGEYFDQYVNGNWNARTKKVFEVLQKFGLEVPTNEQWAALAARVKVSGLYNEYRLAVPPTGSISYINHSTSSIHPIAARIEVRKEGQTGRTYYPAPFMTNDNLEYYKTAYEYGWKAVIDVYAQATKHTDQGLSLTLFFPATATTREINRAQHYAWKMGIKTIYYVRMEQKALAGTEVDGCVSCSL